MVIILDGVMEECMHSKGNEALSLFFTLSFFPKQLFEVSSDHFKTCLQATLEVET